MPNDHGVRVVNHDINNSQAAFLRRYSVALTDDQERTTEVGSFMWRESADRVADAIRKAIEAAVSAERARILSEIQKIGEEDQERDDG